MESNQLADFVLSWFTIDGHYAITNYHLMRKSIHKQGTTQFTKKETRKLSYQ